MHLFVNNDELSEDHDRGTNPILQPPLRFIRVAEKVA
jgi:hypothetical protein